MRDVNIRPIGTCISEWHWDLATLFRSNYFVRRSLICDLTSSVCSCPYLHLLPPPSLSLRSVVSSSPISPARSASLWTLISSATPVTWAECAPHTTFPLTTHTDQRLLDETTPVSTRSRSLMCFLLFLFFSFKMKLLILRLFHWFTFIWSWISPFCHMYCLLYYYCTIVIRERERNYCFFFFFYPNVATVCCRRTRDFLLNFCVYILWLANILHLNLTLL